MADGTLIIHSRLGDCLGFHGLVARCRKKGCRAKTRLHVPTLVERFGGDTYLDSLESKLRCISCGTKGQARLDVSTFIPPAGKEWKYRAFINELQGGPLSASGRSAKGKA